MAAVLGATSRPGGSVMQQATRTPSAATGWAAALTSESTPATGTTPLPTATGAWTGMSGITMETPPTFTTFTGNWWISAPTAARAARPIADHPVRERLDEVRDKLLGL